MNLPENSTLARRWARPIRGWVALAALTQMGMASRGCLGLDDGTDGGTAGTAGSGSTSTGGGNSTGGSTSMAGAGGGDGGCFIDGQFHAFGEFFPTSCQSCSCNPDGGMTCTAQECLPSCGGLTGAACGADQYCKYPASAQCGAADAPGFCDFKPNACDDYLQPVCGCNDQTYANDCYAALAGVSVAASGECSPAGAGGSGTGGTGGYGQCRTNIDCPQPPCACLDENGDNQCDNHCPIFGCVNGQCVDVSPPAATCGGLLGSVCAAGEYCDYAPEARCGRADATGVCKPQPDACTLQYDPVCGCDGNTYGNACAAASAGVSVTSRGECGTAALGLGDSCGGKVPAGSPTCGDGLFCQHQPGALCGAADAPGECVAIPTSCPAQSQPVCGCNGITYANACNAALAQVGILDVGRCN